MRSMIETLVVLCVVVGAYALLALIGAFPDTTLALLIGVAGAFGGFLYGRFGRRIPALPPGKTLP